MPQYYASDIHLRNDRPERAQRLAQFVERLTPGSDRLTIVGDLCDFWYSSRQRQGDDLTCPGLLSLARFAKHGGDLTILPGNHDAWLGPYYERVLKARVATSGVLHELTEGLRITAIHGHQLGARTLWKQAMESRQFLRTFQMLPERLARRLDHMLDQSNVATREARDYRYLELYRRKSANFLDTCDVLVLGHIHRRRDFGDQRPRVVVLGDWTQGFSYLRVEAMTATLHTEQDAVVCERHPGPSGRADPA